MRIINNEIVWESGENGNPIRVGVDIPEEILDGIKTLKLGRTPNGDYKDIPDGKYIFPGETWITELKTFPTILEASEWEME